MKQDSLTPCIRNGQKYEGTEQEIYRREQILKKKLWINKDGFKNSACKPIQEKQYI